MMKLQYFRLRTQYRAWMILKAGMLEDGTIISRPVSGEKRQQLGFDLLRFFGAIKKESRGRWVVSDPDYICQLESWGKEHFE